MLRFLWDFSWEAKVLGNLETNIKYGNDSASRTWRICKRIWNYQHFKLRCRMASHTFQARKGGWRVRASGSDHPGKSDVPRRRLPGVQEGNRKRWIHWDPLATLDGWRVPYTAYTANIVLGGEVRLAWHTFMILSPSWCVHRHGRVESLDFFCMFCWRVTTSNYQYQYQYHPCGFLRGIVLHNKNIKNWSDSRMEDLRRGIKKYLAENRKYQWINVVVKYFLCQCMQ